MEHFPDGSDQHHQDMSGEDWGGYYDDWLGNIEYKEGVGLLVTGTKSREKNAVGLSEAAYAMLLDSQGMVKWDKFYNKAFGDPASLDFFSKGIFTYDNKILLVGKASIAENLTSRFFPQTVIFDKSGNELMNRIYKSIPVQESHAWFEGVEQ